MENTNNAYIIFSICTVVAIIIAPFLAIWATEKLNERKEVKRRKMDIFRDLMATRASGLSPKHVDALNRIDIEFYNASKVFEAWKEYHDHLGLAKDIDTENKEGWENWGSRKEDLLANLLSKMANHLGYKFDTVHIKRGHYYPKAYADIETDQQIIRKGVVEILQDKKPLPVLSIMPEQQFRTLIGLKPNEPPEPETNNSG